MTHSQPEPRESGPIPSYTTEAFLLASMDTRDSIGQLVGATSDFAREHQPELGIVKARRQDPVTGTRWVIVCSDGVVTDIEEFTPPVEGRFLNARTYEFGDDGMTCAVIPYEDYGVRLKTVVDDMPSKDIVEGMSPDEKIKLLAQALGELSRETISAMHFDEMFSTVPVSPEEQKALLQRLKNTIPLAKDTAF